MLTHAHRPAAADAYAAEIVGMYSAELALKERIAHHLCALAAADAAAADAAGESGHDEHTVSGAAAHAPTGQPSREELTVWLSAWLLSPLLHTRRLAEIDALIADEVQSVET